MKRVVALALTAGALVWALARRGKAPDPWSQATDDVGGGAGPRAANGTV